MNLLIVTPYIPFPLNHGGSVAQFGLIDYIRNFIKVTLVLIVTKEEEQQDVENLKKKWENVEFEIIDQRPQPTLRRVVVKSIHYLKTNFRTDNNNFKLDIKDNTTIYWPKSDEFINVFTNIINKRKPDLVQIDFLTFIDLVILVPKKIKTVFVHHELRFAKIESALVLQTQVSNVDNYHYNETKARELAFLKLYDGIIVFSEIDKQKILDLYADINILISPFSIPKSHFNNTNKIADKINKLIFIGGETHHPNIDAIEWYINEIADELGKYNNLTLYVIGKWTPKTIKKYNKPFIHFEGYVDDLADYGKDSIMIVPIRIGSGIRTKILDAMACGIPLITTSVGCEGIKAVDGKDFLIADNSFDFAKKINLLYNDFELRKNIVSNAKETVNQYYGPKSAGDLRIKCYEQILN